MVISQVWSVAALKNADLLVIPPDPKDSGGYTGMRASVGRSVCLSVGRYSTFPGFRMITWILLMSCLWNFTYSFFIPKGRSSSNFFKLDPLAPQGVKNFKKINVSIGFRMITWILLMSCLWNFTYSFFIPKGRSSSKILNFCQKLNFWEIFQISKFGVKIDLCIHGILIWRWISTKPLSNVYHDVI